MNKDFMEYLDKFTHSVHRWYIGLLQERRRTRITSLSGIAEAPRPKILHQVKQVRVLDEASFFLESFHFKRSARGFKQDSRYVKLEYTR
jgi:hypothetical protein